MLGRQGVLNCVPAPDGVSPNPGCNGGDAWMIHKYLSEHKLPDESCLPYEARNMECSAPNICRNCFAPAYPVPKDEQCFAIKNYTGFGVSSYGNLSGEVNMMLEIFTGGPISCSAATDGPFMFNYSQNVLQNDGVYVTDKQYTEDDVDHVMEIAGWGETASGIKYWVVRNSWGTYWGDMGWAKIRRGVNQHLIESDCDWAEPVFDDIDEALQGKVLGDYILGALPVSKFGGGEGAASSRGALASDTRGSSGSSSIVLPPLLAASAQKTPTAAPFNTGKLAMCGLLITVLGGGAAFTFAVATARGRKVPRDRPLLQ